MKQKTTKVFVLIAAILIWQGALAQETVWYQSDYCKPKMVCGHEGHAYLWLQGFYFMG